MLYICIPVHNEAPTVGLLLWRVRKVFQQYAREYEIVVFDDASTDGSADIVRGYNEVLPLTLLGAGEHVGYAQALERCCRDVNARSRYPRRDALIVLQGDFTDEPDHIPELVRRFEGGADVVTAEKATVSGMPAAARRLRTIGRWLVGRHARQLGSADPLSGFRLYRVVVIRDVIRRAGDAPFLTSKGPAADLQLLLAAVPHARRLESVPSTPRYDLRTRRSRLRAASQALAIFRVARSARRLGTAS